MTPVALRSQATPKICEAAYADGTEQLQTPCDGRCAGACLPVALDLALQIKTFAVTTFAEVGRIFLGVAGLEQPGLQVQLQRLSRELGLDQE